MLSVMKPSEYGGSDTDKSDGVQPAPHMPTPSELLRMLYVNDNPADVLSGSLIAGNFGKA